MLCTLKIKLLPNAEQHSALLETLKLFNRACNYISKVAYNSQTFSKFNIQKICYYDIREQFRLSAQMAIRAISKVSESYKADKKKIHIFRDTGAMVYDQRILSYKGLEIASILTIHGRIEVPMVFSSYHKSLIGGGCIRGQADLILQDGIFYLLVVVEVPESTPNSNGDCIGVDLGIVNIAVDSTGEVFSGKAINSVRHRCSKLRSKLQKKGTKSAKRLLRKRSKKEKRFARDVNHCISKKLVGKAKALGTGIALEDLTGIRQRTEKTVKKQQRYRQTSWAFYQLRQYIIYKAQISGVPVVLVNPRNTSRECPICGHTAKENRRSRDNFCCRACGYAAPADNVAAVNIRSRAIVR